MCSKRTEEKERMHRTNGRMRRRRFEYFKHFSDFLIYNNIIKITISAHLFAIALKIRALIKSHKPRA